MRLTSRQLSTFFVTLMMGFGSFAFAQSPKRCRSQVPFAGQTFMICQYHPDELKLFWKKANGQPLASLNVLAREQEKLSKALIFATGSSPTHSDLTPVGLHIENGVELNPLNLENGEGNFFLKPNGVFFFGGGPAGILTSEEFKRQNPRLKNATQSGPMLVINRQINTNLAMSVSRRMRTGVGVRNGGKVVEFVMSQSTVTFPEMARVFKELLKSDEALSISGTSYIPEQRVDHLWTPVGAILGVVQ